MLNIYNNCSECKNRSICKYYGVTDKAKKLLRKAIEEDNDVNTLNIRVNCDSYVKTDGISYYRGIFNI